MGEKWHESRLQWFSSLWNSISNYAISESSSNAYHFHMALKLQKRGRCLQVRNYLDEKFGIQVHFSGNHNTYYRVYQKKCPKWKIASTSDIPQNLGYFLPARISRSLLVYLGQKIIFPSTFMLPGGCFLSSNFEKACAQKCQPENGIFFNWLQV